MLPCFRAADTLGDGGKAFKRCPSLHRYYITIQIVRLVSQLASESSNHSLERKRTSSMIIHSRGLLAVDPSLRLTKTCMHCIIREVPHFPRLDILDHLLHQVKSRDGPQRQTINRRVKPVLVRCMYHLCRRLPPPLLLFPLLVVVVVSAFLDICLQPDPHAPHWLPNARRGKQQRR